MAKKQQNTLFYVLYWDKTWATGQSECLQGPLYAIIVNYLMQITTLTGSPVS